MHSYDIVKKLIPSLNERQLTDVDFSFTADFKGFDVCEMKLKKRGYHVWDDGVDYIFIKKALRGIKWLETAFHELFHAVLQIPMKALHDKQQKEVVALSLIAIIPFPMLENYTFLEENPTPYARRLFKEREKIYFFYGV